MWPEPAARPNLQYPTLPRRRRRDHAERLLGLRPRQWSSVGRSGCRQQHESEQDCPRAFGTAWPAGCATSKRERAAADPERRVAGFACQRQLHSGDGVEYCWRRERGCHGSCTDDFGSEHIRSDGEPVFCCNERPHGARFFDVRCFGWCVGVIDAHGSIFDLIKAVLLGGDGY